MPYLSLPGPDVPVPSHPSLEFMSELISDMSPAAQQLVEDTYRAHYFGQGDQGLTEGFAVLSSTGALGWGVEQKEDHYRIKREVCDFFDADGSRHIARLALDHHDIAEQGRIDSKASAIRSCWDSVHANLPTYNEALEVPSMAELERPARQERSVQGSVDFISQFIQIDTAWVRAGREPGMYEDKDARISLTRESILMRPYRKSGSKMFDDMLTGFQRTILIGKCMPELRDLAYAWQKYHADNFMPDFYKTWVDL